ncbi:MAG: Holliday junction branch migration protein RuvA [Anaerolineae bacterium]|nr:Holliday junction branch migration protein RuvA [Anaerolineae bacterium]
MIARLSGDVWDIGENWIVVGAGGVGFRVHVPASVHERVAGVGQVELYTYLHVRESELALYGFLTDEELSLFKLLLSVSGIGPKVALAMLSSLSPDVLRDAVLHEDPGVLTRVPGVGAKTASAVIFHLRDKITVFGEGVSGAFGETDAEVIAALTGLGFSIVEAQRALQSVARDPDLSLEERVRQALTYFATR